MKKYSVFELKVLKINRGNDTHQCLICEYDEIKNNYIEIFTKERINPDDIKQEYSVEPLCNYYSIISVAKYQRNGITKPLKLNIKQLFKKYNEINYLNLYLESDINTIATELFRRGIYEKSKIYKNRTFSKN